MLGCSVWDPDPEISCFEVVDVLFFRAEGFSCSLDGLYGGLGMSKLQYFYQKNITFFFSCKYVKKILVRNRIGIGIQPKMLDPDPRSSESGSETLLGGKQTTFCEVSQT
jgi:hypothetical protein